MTDELLDFCAEGTYISAENILLTLKKLTKRMQEYRGDVPFDFTFEIKQREEVSK